MPITPYHFYNSTGDCLSFYDLADAAAQAARDITRATQSVTICRINGQRWELTLSQDGRQILTLHHRD